LFGKAVKTMSFSKKREIQAKSSVLAAGSYCTESAFAIRLYLLCHSSFYKKEFAMRMHIAAWMSALVFGLGMISSLEAGVWTSGHGDIDAHFHNGALEVGLHFHSGAGALGGGTLPEGHHEADEYQIFVPGTPITLPGTPAWAFAGSPGDSLWFLPPTNVAGRPYLGWSSDELPAALWSNITFTLLSVNGPAGGVFSVFTESVGVPTVKLSSVDGFAKSFTLVGGSHDHYNVGFNRAGTFDVKLRVSATRISDSQTFSGDGTFTFYVDSVPSGGEVPEPGSIAIFSVFAMGSGYRMLKRRKSS
jgi:surface-anchored protein